MCFWDIPQCTGQPPQQCIIWPQVSSVLVVSHFHLRPFLLRKDCAGFFLVLVCWYGFFQLLHVYFAFIFGIFPKIQNPLLWTYGSNSILLLFHLASLILKSVTTSLLSAALSSPLFLSVFGVLLSAGPREQWRRLWLTSRDARLPAFISKPSESLGGLCVLSTCCRASHVVAVA